MTLLRTKFIKKFIQQYQTDDIEYIKINNTVEHIMHFVSMSLARTTFKLFVCHYFREKLFEIYTCLLLITFVVELSFAFCIKNHSQFIIDHHRTHTFKHETCNHDEQHKTNQQNNNKKYCWQLTLLIRGYQRTK